MKVQKTPDRKKIDSEQVLKKTGWSRTTLYRRLVERDCDFPKPKNAGRCHWWYEDEVDSYIDLHPWECRKGVEKASGNVPSQPGHNLANIADLKEELRGVIRSEFDALRRDFLSHL